MIIKKQFPQDFFHFGAAENAYIVPEREINEWIKDCIERLKKDEQKPYSMTACGDTIIFVERYGAGVDEYYEVAVCKNYYSESIFQEDILG